MYIHRAYCKKCGVSKKETSDRAFLDRFFLGDRCNNCGDYKPDKLFDDGWVRTYGKWVKEKQFVLLKPSTWFSALIWEEYNDKNR